MQTKNPSPQFHIVAGFTASNLDSSLTLLSDIAELPPGCSLRSLVIGCDEVEPDRLRPGLDSLRSRGVKVVLVHDKEVMDAALNGQFGEYYSARERQAGIAFHRTVLHHYLYREACSLPNPVVWILDDDVRLQKTCFLVESYDGRVSVFRDVGRPSG